MDLKTEPILTQLLETYSRRKLNALYREIPLRDTVFRVLRKYFNAMANLYGIIPLRKAYEIISSQTGRLVSEEEFLAFSEIARHECEDYYLLGQDELYLGTAPKDALDREIIDIILLGNDLSAYQEVRQAHRGKPYYIPGKAALLAFEDPFYYEPTPEASALSRFLARHLRADAGQADALMEEIAYATRCLNVSISEILSRLHALGVTFHRQKDIEDFCALYQDFHNHTRMQCNRGYTPDEIFAMQPPQTQIPRSISFGPNLKKALVDGSMDAEQLRRDILGAGLPSEELRTSILAELAAATGTKPAKAIKVGRNDLCPCGSGKKYKKCCGR